MTSRRRQAEIDRTRVLGYVRVSTAEQAESGLGLDAQRSAIEAECARRGWTLVEVFEDAGASGRSTRNRDGLASALAGIEAGRGGTLMVSKLDRLSRSLVDFSSLMADAVARGWNLVALDLGIDLSTPAGEFMASVMASAAQWERRIIGQRTRDALAVKKAQGVKLGRPRTMPAVIRARIVTDRDAGAGWTAIAQQLNDEGVATAQGGAIWYPATVRAAYLAA
jgi:DNA invertase Pin-like site-specific DNA recombinase